MDPKTFADVLRSPEHPDWQEAYDRLRAIFRHHLQRGTLWPRVRESAVAKDRDLADELAHDFWLRLRDDPRILRASAVRGYGAIGWEVIRFLRTPALDSIEVAETRLREHFAGKVRTALRLGEFRELRRN